MKERARRFPRRVQVRFWGASTPDNSYAGYSRNISATGMFIATIHPHKPGTRMLIEFQEDGKTFEVGAIVAHSAKVSPLLQAVRPSGMGVRFSSRSLELERLLPEGEIQVVDDEDRIVYPIYFSDVDELLEVYDRDIRNGGLFVPTSRPAPMDQEVSVELNLPRTRKSVVTVVAKVVQRTEDGPNPGMGIAFSNPDEVVGTLFDLIQDVRSASS
jgi:Tfp pilus assembly protein PilZ